MGKDPKAYFSGIEKKLIELIDESEKSIKIAMAWFTSPEIKNCLIKKKISNPSIEISIVVDDNDMNKSYFFNSKSRFEKVGIEIREKVIDRFLHHKFMVIDEIIVITGSYNYSKRANSSLENIVVINSSKLGSNYSRIFEFLTNSNYLDENVQLLFDNPRFAQEIISTYYPFDESEYLEYRTKIEIGDCYTHFNGMYNEIAYNPGLVFNSILSKRNYLEDRLFEFNPPIKKEDIKNYLKDRNERVILDSFEGEEESYHLINGELEKNEKSIKKYFKRKMEKTYRYPKLERLIKDGVDIILEDDLWTNNFEPFLSKELIEKIFDNIGIAE
jgi:hypothetical protein